MSRYHYEALASESEFEELMCDLHNAIYKTNTFQLYKNRGSKQFGIDIFSREEGVVIQCKKKDPARRDKELRAELAADLRENVTKAHGLPFGFKTFILAVTTKKYGDVQKLAMELSGQFPFSVQLLAWIDIEKQIHFYPDIRNRYYPHLKPGRKDSPPESRILRAPIVGTIGANATIKNSIIELFNKLGNERRKRHGPSAFPVMYNKFKKDFGIKDQLWTCIWDWPETAASSIRYYLDAKYDNTKAGRIEARQSDPDHIPSRLQLIVRETKALAFFDLDMRSPEVKTLLQELYGVNSHTKLTHLNHWLFVLHLEGKARSVFGE